MQDVPGTIHIRGARAHNLRNLDLDLPRGKLVVFVGVSGSGKSTLAFDTLFAEGQRRYVESLAPSMRRFLNQLPRADVDEITGLPPTLAVSQSQGGGNQPRSTVATATEIHDFLRLLYARTGDLFCSQCGAPLDRHSVDEIADELMRLPEGSRMHLLAPLVRNKKGHHREEFQLIRREGFVRARLDGTYMLIDSPPEVDPDQPHTLDMVVDRQVIRPNLHQRLTESIRTAIKYGGGVVGAAIETDDEEIERLFNAGHACLVCGSTYQEVEPRSFSFNSPYGACSDCQGLGTLSEVRLDDLADDLSKSLAGGALTPFRTAAGKLTAPAKKQLQTWANWESLGKLPLSQLTPEIKRELWEGTDAFVGVRALLEKLPDSDALLQQLGKRRVCSTCHGTRLGPVGRSVRVDGRTIAEFTALSVDEAMDAAAAWKFAPKKAPIAEPLQAQISQRLAFLKQVGLAYLDLDRPVATLSGGEWQRIRLAGCLGGGLSGVAYVLDEPSIGLHPRDTDRLVQTLVQLRDQRSSVFVVEHDAATLAAADWVVELGPGAGNQGGELVANLDRDSFQQADTLTAAYFRGDRTIERQTPRLPINEQTPRLGVHIDRIHNIGDLTVDIPLGRLICVTGVSGSGKSTLVMDCLAPSLREMLSDKSRRPPAPTHEAGVRLRGYESLQSAIEVDQGPIGSSPRSIPATFVGIWDSIRDLFAKTRDAKLRGFTASRFSFNNKEGQCPECQGLGAKKVELQFLPDLYVPCERCRGQRFNRATLAIRFRGKSAGQLLAMTVRDASEFFANHPKIAGPLDILSEVGLDYLQLGQWANTLSGGEAQRLKLAAELGKPRVGQNIYLLDEPTTGLHFADVDHLLRLLERLVEAGHTVVVIEHHLELMRAADWLIDMGPDGGIHGGKIVGEGNAEVLATLATPTGIALAKSCHHSPKPPV